MRSVTSQHCLLSLFRPSVPAHKSDSLISTDEKYCNVLVAAITFVGNWEGKLEKWDPVSFVSLGSLKKCGYIEFCPLFQKWWWWEKGGGRKLALLNETASLPQKKFLSNYWTFFKCFSRRRVKWGKGNKRKKRGKRHFSRRSLFMHAFGFGFDESRPKLTKTISQSKYWLQT